MPEMIIIKRAAVHELMVSLYRAEFDALFDGRKKDDCRVAVRGNAKQGIALTPTDDHTRRVTRAVKIVDRQRVQRGRGRSEVIYACMWLPCDMVGVVHQYREEVSARDALVAKNAIILPPTPASWRSAMLDEIVRQQNLTPEMIKAFAERQVDKIIDEAQVGAHAAEAAVAAAAPLPAPELARDTPWEQPTERLRHLPSAAAIEAANATAAPGNGEAKPHQPNSLYAGTYIADQVRVGDPWQPALQRALVQRAEQAGEKAAMDALRGQPAPQGTLTEEMGLLADAEETGANPRDFAKRRDARENFKRILGLLREVNALAENAGEVIFGIEGNKVIVDRRYRP